MPQVQANTTKTPPNVSPKGRRHYLMKVLHAVKRAKSAKRALCVAVFCSVLQRVAVCCSVLQCVVLLAARATSTASVNPQKRPARGIEEIVPYNLHTQRAHTKSTFAVALHMNT